VSKTKTITCTLNGEPREFTIEPSEMLMDLLRRHGLVGTKNGCSDGACGSCSVILDGRSVNACITFAFQIHERELWSIEGLGDFDNPHPFQKAMVEEAGIQCGFCIPGIIMSVKALLDEIPQPTDEQIRENLDGNFCRCTGYEKIENAIYKVIGRKPEGAAR
jgi:carbon-monoxide dehydrogenase small subunit